jgi:hypothetical protein
MGFLLKIVVFGVAAYFAWKTIARWTALLGGRGGKPEEFARRGPSPAARAPTGPIGQRKVVVEDTVQCAGCGAYISSAADKCGHCGRLRS